MKVKRAESMKLVRQIVRNIGTRHHFTDEQLDLALQKIGTGMSVSFIFETDFQWGTEVSVRLAVSKDLEPDVQISWSSTHRSIAAATIALANYQRALLMAAELQAAIGRLTIEG